MKKAKVLNSSVTKSVTSPKSDGGIDIIKVILIIAIVGFLAYNLYLYFTEGTDVLGKYFGIGIVGVAKGTEKSCRYSSRMNKRYNFSCSKCYK